MLSRAVSDMKYAVSGYWIQEREITCRCGTWNGSVCRTVKRPHQRLVQCLDGAALPYPVFLMPAAMPLSDSSRGRSDLSPQPSRLRLSSSTWRKDMGST